MTIIHISNNIHSFFFLSQIWWRDQKQQKYDTFTEVVSIDQGKFIGMCNIFSLKILHCHFHPECHVQPAMEGSFLVMLEVDQVSFYKLVYLLIVKVKYDLRKCKLFDSVCTEISVKFSNSVFLFFIFFSHIEVKTCKEIID